MTKAEREYFRGHLIRIGPMQNRAKARAELVKHRAEHTRRWNKGGEHWRCRAQRLGQQRARREGQA